MKTSYTPSTRIIDLQQIALPAVLGVLSMIITLTPGCTIKRVEPKMFASPEEATQALVGAVRAENTDQLLAIFGSEGKSIILSGDEVADRQSRQKFLTHYDEKHSIVDDGKDSKTLVIGTSDWPLPVPIVRKDRQWVFDAEAGKEEILNRRIGGNELSTIEACKAIADAQHEYALTDPDGNGVHEYAKQFVSDPGKHNGLYWHAKEGEKISPLGELAAEAAKEGYTRKKGEPIPYHGYYYHILHAQGPHAPNGAMDYMAKGKMILGFALIAYPAEYDNSGIMTFIMGSDGVVYQKDLGKETSKLALDIKVYDPGEGWQKVE
jgi:hypothetical protein